MSTIFEFIALGNYVKVIAVDEKTGIEISTLFPKNLTKKLSKSFFWVFWIIAIIVVVSIFLYADNNWLENKTDDPPTSRYCSNKVDGYRRWY